MVRDIFIIHNKMATLVHGDVKIILQGAGGQLCCILSGCVSMKLKEMCPFRDSSE